MTINIGRTYYRGRATGLPVTCIPAVDPQMEEIFPGYFYGYTASGIVLLKKYQSCDGFTIISFDSTTSRLIDEKLTKADHEYLDKLATLEGVLYDFNRDIVVDDKNCIYASAPKGERQILFQSATTAKLYLFDTPGWVLTACNDAAKMRYSESYPTVQGKMFLATLSSEMSCEDVPINDIWRINNVSVPHGSHTAVVIEQKRLNTIIQAAKAYQAKKSSPLKVYKQGISLQFIRDSKGIPETTLNWSKLPANKNLKIPVIMDDPKLKEYLRAAYINDGRVFVDVKSVDDEYTGIWNEMFDVFNQPTLTPTFEGIIKE